MARLPTPEPFDGLTVTSIRTGGEQGGNKADHYSKFLYNLSPLQFSTRSSLAEVGLIDLHQ